MGDGVLPVQVRAGPVVGEQLGGQVPVCSGLGVPDGLRRVTESDAELVAAGTTVAMS